MTIKSRRQHIIEFLRSLEGQQIATRLLACVPPERKHPLAQFYGQLQAAITPEKVRWLVEWASGAQAMNAWIDQVGLGPNGEVLFKDGEDWFWRPVYAGMCRFESIKDGTLTLADIAIMNALIDAREQRRLSEDKRAPTTGARTQQTVNEWMLAYVQTLPQQKGEESSGHKSMPSVGRQVAASRSRVCRIARAVQISAGKAAASIKRPLFLYLFRVA